jgi:hypothetical protein
MQKGDVVNLINNYMQVLASSDDMKVKGEKVTEGKRISRYPFEKLTVGYSFGVIASTGPEVVSLNNALAYRNRKGLGVYVIVNHSKTTPGLYEIGMVLNGLEEDEAIGELYPVCPCSPEALIEMNKAVDKAPKTKYPFTKLNVGESFIIPAEVLNKRSVAVLCSRFGKSLNRKFITTIHNDGRCEVGRIK